LAKTSALVNAQLFKTPRKYDIIAHSFGGIVIKNIIARQPKICGQINSIAFISVPHQGSWLAALTLFWPAAIDTLPFRKHFKDLSNIPLPQKLANFIPQTDIKIRPKQSSSLNGCKDSIIHNCNHDSIINNEIFINQLINFLKNK
jgi:predicted alpha/beta hydrolase family esterase